MSSAIFMRRRSYAFAVFWLLLMVTFTVPLLFNSNTPFDARTGQPLVGAKMVMSVFGIAIEPILAPFFIIAGAPDYRIAAISCGLWLFVGTMAYVFVDERSKAFHIRCFRSFWFAFKILALFLLYLVFVLVTPLPSWSLVVNDPTSIVADLHSHTLASHDAIVPGSQSLAVHRDAGYHVVAWTEHYPGPWRSTVAAATRSSDVTPVIAGLEVNREIDGAFWQNYYFVLLGVGSEFPLDDWLIQVHDEPTLRAFTDKIHDIARGVVLVVNKSLREKDIQRLVAAGVDGFEIANFGHPHITPPIRDAMVAAQQSHRVGLVAVSDWHGWSSFFRTWTIVTSAGSDQHPAEQVLSALRERQSDRIIPVVSQMFDEPSLIRKIFAPFIEPIRYAHELSTARLLSWWLWALCSMLILRVIRYFDLRAGLTFLIMTSGGLGLALLFRGADLIVMWHLGAPHRLPLYVGLISAASGTIGLFSAGWKAREMFLERSLRRTQAAG